MKMMKYFVIFEFYKAQKTRMLQHENSQITDPHCSPLFDETTALPVLSLKNAAVRDAFFKI